MQHLIKIKLLSTTYVNDKSHSQSQYYMPFLFIQILCMLDALDSINTEKVAKYVKDLQQENGSFFGDKWGEVDTRFSFCAVACLSLLVSYTITYDSPLVLFHTL